MALASLLTYYSISCTSLPLYYCPIFSHILGVASCGPVLLIDAALFLHVLLHYFSSLSFLLPPFPSQLGRFLLFELVSILGLAPNLLPLPVAHTPFPCAFFRASFQWLGLAALIAPPWFWLRSCLAHVVSSLWFRLMVCVGHCFSLSLFLCFPRLVNSSTSPFSRACLSLPSLSCFSLSVVSYDPIFLFYLVSLFFPSPRFLSLVFLSVSTHFRLHTFFCKPPLPPC